ncbi:N-acetylglucosamine-6-phosphate deacetylase [Bacillus sp. THAF10]|uniref:N-acetylglucosamine-6-phosphate deacetylase n=1 Tax=Bacillus sp. THAF10 TaxID=2587848 RepID=UPI001267EC40|nr:N-acetylglucosamine-6-phosphate deacetylase [Bacillus sp. THAF10]QFT88643.1 N-acetylglucosamine-6-phosphate deacetylase [Bacillus sp. THAF10]
MKRPPNSYALISVRVITEKNILNDAYIKWKDGRIVEYGTMETYQNNESLMEWNMGGKFIAAPGFIDLHIHGSNGADVMDCNEQALQTISSSLVKEGTTAFLATTITNSKEKITSALKSVNQYINKTADTQIGSQLLGVHLEGPFINSIRAGAQPLEHIYSPCLDTFQQFQLASGNHIKIVTMAPEMPNGYLLVKKLSESGIIASIGHSDALYEEMILAMEAGAKHVTHLYNGMRGSHHREPGVVGASLAHPELMLELIADGIHVHPAVIKATYLAKGANGLILITDAMRAKWLEDGEYELGGQRVFVKNNTARLQDGTLAGSVIKMNVAVTNMMDFTGCTLQEAIRMASINPARQLKLDHQKGSIALGKDADIVILDTDLNVKMTFIKGELVYKGD